MEKELFESPEAEWIFFIRNDIVTMSEGEDTTLIPGEDGNFPWDDWE